MSKGPGVPVQPAPARIKRVLSDRISRWLFTTSADADDNLATEGLPLVFAAHP